MALDTLTQVKWKYQDLGLAKKEFRKLKEEIKREQKEAEKAKKKQEQWGMIADIASAAFTYFFPIAGILGADDFILDAIDPTKYGIDLKIDPKGYVFGYQSVLDANKELETLEDSLTKGRDDWKEDPFGWWGDHLIEEVMPELVSMATGSIGDAEGMGGGDGWFENMLNPDIGSLNEGKSRRRSMNKGKARKFKRNNPQWDSIYYNG